MPRITKLQRQQELVTRLVKEMFMAVGLYVSNNYVFDQDSNLPWKFKDRLVKYANPGLLTTIHSNETLFDPLMSKAMVKDLLDIGIAKAIRYDDLYMKALAPEINHGSKTLVLLTDKDKIRTGTYFHEIVTYYDMAFILAEMKTEEMVQLLIEVDQLLSEVLPKKRTRGSTRKKDFFNGIYR
ncbi:MAG: hypothetical protein PHC62_01050 [Candidatus Izemoplasmatales bacterium]|nr:hypothetical protein [Candidatus Izemoplasmatales bacterium]